jgi:hypothetical protein
MLPEVSCKEVAMSKKVLITDPFSGHQYWEDEFGKKMWHRDGKFDVFGRASWQDGDHGKRDYFNEREDGVAIDGAYSTTDEFGLQTFRHSSGKKQTIINSPTGYTEIHENSPQNGAFGFGGMSKDFGFDTSLDNSKKGYGDHAKNGNEQGHVHMTEYHSNDGKTLYLADNTSDGMFSGNQGSMLNGNFSMFSNGSETMLSVGDQGDNDTSNFGMGSMSANNGFDSMFGHNNDSGSDDNNGGHWGF